MEQLALNDGHRADSTATPMQIGISADEVMKSDGVHQYFMFLQNNVVNMQQDNVQNVIEEAERRHNDILRMTIELYDQRCRYAMERAVSDVKREYETRMHQGNMELEGARKRISDLEAKIRELNEQVLEKDARILRVESGMAKTENDSRELIQRIIGEASLGAQQKVEALMEEHRVELQQARATIDELQAEVDAMHASLQSQAQAEEMPQHRPSEARGAEIGDGLHDFAREQMFKAFGAATSSQGQNLRPKEVGATGNGPPKISLPVTKDDDERSFHSPSMLSHHDGNDQTQQLLKTLSKLVENRESDSKPKVKEAETIKLPDQPTPETYRHWKNSVREEICAASDKSDKAWEWLKEVYDKETKTAEKMQKLQDPGEFGTLDTKLRAALTRSAKGDLGQRILNYKEEQAVKGKLVRGRQVLLMFDEYFRTSEEAGNLYQLEDLLKVARVGDSIDHLKAVHESVGSSSRRYEPHSRGGVAEGHLHAANQRMPVDQT